MTYFCLDDGEWLEKHGCARYVNFGSLDWSFEVLLSPRLDVVIVLGRELYRDEARA
jgi:hypothetical protein